MNLELYPQIQQMLNINFVMISYRSSVTSTGPVGKNMDMSVISSLAISESITFENHGMNSLPSDHWN